MPAAVSLVPRRPEVRQIELQNLAAVLECTSKSLSPGRYRDMDRAEKIRRANELAALTRQ